MSSIQILRGDSWAEALLQLLDEHPTAVESWMERRARILKSDSHSRVGLLTIDGQLCYLKFYRYKSSLQRLGYRLGRGRAIHAYDAALQLRSAGVRAPQPLACLRLGSGVMLLTEGVVDSADLKSLWLQGLEEQRLQAAMVAAAESLASLHRAGFSHGDCKWSNFLCSEDAILFIDLEGVRAAAPGSKGMLRDLARFTLNAEDMGLAPHIFQQFLHTYSAQLSWPQEDLPGAIRTALLPMRQRHLRSYGPRGHTLL